MADKESDSLIPEQGWHCLHLFYRIEFGQWQLLSPEEQRAAKTRLASLVQEVRALPVDEQDVMPKPFVIRR